MEFPPHLVGAAVCRPRPGSGHDRLAVLCRGEALLLAVADGAGGLAGAAEAAEHVTRRLAQLGGGSLLLGSDGLFADLPPGEAVALLAAGDPQQALGELFRLRGSRSGGPDDDASAILVRARAAR